MQYPPATMFCFVDGEYNALCIDVMYNICTLLAGLYMNKLVVMCDIQNMNI